MLNGCILQSESDSISKAKKDTIKAAKDLKYSKQCIEALKNAKTLNELSRIMKAERNKD